VVDRRWSQVVSIDLELMMSDTNLGSTQPPTGSAAPQAAYEAREARVEGPEPTGWVGWGVFAAVMMLMMGSFHAIAGLVALFRDDYYLVSKNGLVVHADYTAWGWTYLIGGALIVVAGAALLSGKMWARVVAVALAILSAIANMAFFEAYPWWSAIMITLDVLVIWALTVHGAEMKSLR
jgi:hypothetical protein